MRFKFIVSSLAMLLFGCNKSGIKSGENVDPAETDSTKLSYILSPPVTKGNVTLEEAISKRRSRRNIQSKEISAEQLSQILWACYGITSPQSGPSHIGGGLRSTPSAGALYPLDIYVLVGNVKGIEPGVYKYIPKGHRIIRTIDKDTRKELSDVASNLKIISLAPVVLVYSAVFSRCTDKFGSIGRERYVCMEVGHSAQNVYLQVEALHLGTYVIGWFNDSKVKKIMQLRKDQDPLYIMPVGYY